MISAWPRRSAVAASAPGWCRHCWIGWPGAAPSPVRLHTEGHDPAGALRLYQRHGFAIVGRSHRFRKQL